MFIMSIYTHSGKNLTIIVDGEAQGKALVEPNIRNKPGAIPILTRLHPNITYCS